jgi:hypothetical protein
VCLLQQLGAESDGSSPQLGWAADGFPLFGPRGPGGVLMKRCGAAGADATYCVDACGGYNGAWNGQDDFLYRYFLMGEDSVARENPLAPTPTSDFFPHAPFCLLGCGDVYANGNDRNPSIGNHMPACGGAASAGTAAGYAAAPLAASVAPFEPVASHGFGGGATDDHAVAPESHEPDLDDAEEEVSAAPPAATLLPVVAAVAAALAC